MPKQPGDRARGNCPLKGLPMAWLPPRPHATAFALQYCPRRNSA
jgi:hypothetical protein